MKTLLAILILFSAAHPLRAADFTITFTVPDAAATGYITDLAEALGYQPIVFDNERNELPNPVSRLDFIKSKIGADLIRRISELRAQRAADAATEAAKAATTEAIKTVIIK